MEALLIISVVLLVVGFILWIIGWIRYETEISLQTPHQVSTLMLIWIGVFIVIVAGILMIVYFAVKYRRQAKPAYTQIEIPDDEKQKYAGHVFVDTKGRPVTIPYAPEKQPEYLTGKTTEETIQQTFQQGQKIGEPVHAP